jgi:hypothetical protein
VSAEPKLRAGSSPDDAKVLSGEIIRRFPQEKLAALSFMV